MPDEALILDEGNLAALQALIDRGLSLRLFTNDRVPTRLDTIETFTELGTADYGAQSLIGSRWSFMQGTPARASYPRVDFVFNGFRGNVFGWFITTGRKVVAAGRFKEAPWKVVNVGDVIGVAPTLLFGDNRDAGD